MPKLANSRKLRASRSDRYITLHPMPLLKVSRGSNLIDTDIESAPRNETGLALRSKRPSFSS
jgi:hypothetical protein